MMIANQNLNTKNVNNQITTDGKIGKIYEID